MAEEQRCQEGHRLCANNCGFFGSPATLNLCSKCYRDFHLNEEQASSAKIAVEKSLLASPSSYSPPSSSAPAADVIASSVGEASGDVESPLAVGLAEEQRRPEPTQAPSRCAACRKRVGLTGFRCRCGDTYCGTHRYPEGHGCTFDFKTTGRKAIALANPVVKAHKLGKI